MVLKRLDVFSNARLNKILDEKTESVVGAFGSEFYLNQMEPERRKLVIQALTVRKEFYEERK